MSSGDVVTGVAVIRWMIEPLAKDGGVLLPLGVAVGVLGVADLVRLIEGDEVGGGVEPELAALFGALPLPRAS